MELASARRRRRPRWRASLATPGHYHVARSFRLPTIAAASGIGPHFVADGGAQQQSCPAAAPGAAPTARHWCCAAGFCALRRGAGTKATCVGAVSAQTTRWVATDGGGGCQKATTIPPAGGDAVRAAALCSAEYCLLLNPAGAPSFAQCGGARRVLHDPCHDSQPSARSQAHTDAALAAGEALLTQPDTALAVRAFVASEEPVSQAWTRDHCGSGNEAAYAKPPPHRARSPALTRAHASSLLRRPPRCGLSCCTWLAGSSSGGSLKQPSRALVRRPPVTTRWLPSVACSLLRRTPHH